MTVRCLGISATGRDSAAALVIDGDIVAAAQEERFSRLKQDGSFPEQAIRYCLKEAGIDLSEVDFIECQDRQTAKDLARLFASPGCLEKTTVRTLAHHLAASAFYPSPFDSALVIGWGGHSPDHPTTLWKGDGASLELIREIPHPHSLGALYSAITGYIGFRPGSAEYKVMGLAPYGVARFENLISTKILAGQDDGTWAIKDPAFLEDRSALEDLFGYPARLGEGEDLSSFHMDVAASLQASIEHAMLRFVRSVKASNPGENTLCLAGDLALNCVANSKLLNQSGFANLWIQPASGRSGLAIGAAFSAYHARQDREGVRERMAGAFLGPAFGNPDIRDRLAGAGAVFEDLPGTADLVRETTSALVSGKVVGWFQGRMEFGPRALGGRSILGDPRSAAMQKTMNLKIKYRESFRPFAPSVLNEDVEDWFDLDGQSPYMLIVADVKENHRKQMTAAQQALFGIDKLNVARSSIPAVTHVDYSARIQTVHAETNPLYHALISAFKEQTGCPVVVNTSFNVRGEPIVCTPEDAFRCFMGTEMDVLVVGSCILKKENQNASLAKDYKDAFELD